jgi:hypothetical protein
VGEVKVRIVDYADREVPMLARTSGRRRTGYRSIGYREAAAVGHTVFPRDDGDHADDRTGDPLESHKWSVADPGSRPCRQRVAVRFGPHGPTVDTSVDTGSEVRPSRSAVGCLD